MRTNISALAALLVTALTGPALSMELPTEMKQNGLRIAVAPNYPPMEFKDPGTPVSPPSLRGALGAEAIQTVAGENFSIASLPPSLVELRRTSRSQ